MRPFIVLFPYLLTVYIQGVQAGVSSHWDYTDPKEWCEKDKTSACCGHAQSPIAIHRKNCFDVNYPLFAFSGYKNQRKAILSDNGHTVVISFSKDKKARIPKIQGGNLRGAFKFDSLHFHWGPNNSIGSEHSVDGIDYPLEVHLVHYKDKFKSVEEAVKQDDSLLVLGVLFKECEKQVDNCPLKVINEILNDHIYNEESKTLTQEISLRSFLPKNTRNYFTYYGSLTTPPCSEIVNWVLFEETVCVTKKQLQNFHTHIHARAKRAPKGRSSSKSEAYTEDHDDSNEAENEDEDLILDNHRKTQALWQRHVFRVKATKYAEIRKCKRNLE